MSGHEDTLISEEASAILSSTGLIPIYQKAMAHNQSQVGKEFSLFHQLELKLTAIPCLKKMSPLFTCSLCCPQNALLSDYCS